MRKILTLAAFLICSITMSFAQYSGSGSGTQSDPYRIFYADQLTQLRNFLNQTDVYFKLMNDIDLTDWLAENYPGQGWQPVGSSSEPFKGILDGNNKTISGFSINRTTTDYVGLFGYVSGATIKNLTLKGTIKGKGYVGSLMGSGSATVTNYTFEGTVTGTGNYTGGVGGFQNTSSTNLTVTATVSGANYYTGGIYGRGAGINTATFTGSVTGSSNVGGLEGTGGGTISACVVNGPVKSTNSSATYVGGLIGYASSTTTANNCKQEGIVQGKSYTGGLVGGSQSNITISSGTHRGNITGTTYTGGIIGGTKSGTLSLSSCYAEGDIVALSYVGGICGELNGPAGSGILSCNYWGNIQGSSNLGGIVGRFLTNYSTIDFSTSVSAGTRGDVDTHSKSACFFNTSSPSWRYYSGGNGYYEINGNAQIITSEDVQDWVKGTAEVYYHNASSGHTMTAPVSVYKNCYERGGSATTIIQNCSAIGNITGTGEYIGGLVGQDIQNTQDYQLSNSKTIYYYDGGSSTKALVLKKYTLVSGVTNISESYYSGNLSGTNYIGGISGNKEGGIVTKCYSSASISGNSKIGGIVGCLQKNDLNTSVNNLSSNISVCTNITGTSNVGRIYGYTDGNFSVAALGTNSENRSMASTQVVVNGVPQTITDNLQNGTAVGVSQLRLMANYVAWGWDFNNCWTIQDTESFPYKTWQSAPPTFSGRLISGATTISGKSIDGGTVYLTTSSGKNYTATCSGSNWSVTVSALHAGETVTAYAATTDKEKSYFSTTTVSFLGSGTEDDPYQIASAEDLQGINKEGYYKIMNDIDLTSWINENSSTAGWVPVGFSGDGFFNLEGDNHTISGLWVNSTNINIGLFSSLNHATIKNLTVITSARKVKGGNYTGILAGRLADTSVENVSVQGTVEGNSPVGGILGEASSISLNNCTVQATLSGGLKIGGVVGCGSYILDQCSYSGSISSTTSNACIGGLAGSGSGTYETENGTKYNIRKCKADVTISASGTGSRCGGLVGGDTGAMIVLSKSSGTITATGSDSYAGGLVGYLSSGSIMNCYSTANTSSTLYAAGLVGYNEKSAITKCYASGNVNSTYYGAGVIGYNDGANATLTNSVAMGTIVNVSDQSGWGIRVLGGYKNSAPEPDNSNFGWSGMQISVNGVPKTVTENDLDGLSLSTAQTKQSATYTAIGWDFNDVWTIEEGVGYPKLEWEGETGPTVVLATGVTLDQTSITLITAGQTATLTATVEPADVTDGSVSWTSSDISVATVSSEGVVTAVANGTATITATTNDGSNLTATCTVTVNITTTVLATGVTLSQSSITLTNAGETATLTATVAPGNVTDGSVTWTSSDETFATVSSEGVVTAVANGTATITATTNDGTNLTASCTVTVAIPEDDPDPDTDISQIDNVVYMESTEVSAGSEETLSIKMKNTDGIQTLQFDLYLPEGVEVLTDEDDFELIDLSTERTTARKMDQFSVQRMSNGAYRVLINSSRGYTFDGTDGEIATVQVGISETMTPGNYPVIFRDIVLVNTSSVGYETDYVKCSLNIPDYKPGDVNNDTKVNAIDLNAITNYILERRDFPFTFNKKAANINGDKEANGDEKINAIDLNAVTNMILNQGATTSGANRRRVILIPD